MIRKLALGGLCRLEAPIQLQQMRVRLLFDRGKKKGREGREERGRERRRNRPTSFKLHMKLKFQNHKKAPVKIVNRVNICKMNLFWAKWKHTERKAEKY